MRLADATSRDRSWRLWATVAVVSALAFSLIFGFVVLPVVQGRSVGLNVVTSIGRAIGVSPGAPTAPGPVTGAQAQPRSFVVWTPGLLRTLAKPPAPAGQAATAACASCHGERGVATSPQFPDLAGQSPEAIYKQLHDFKSGRRTNPIMTPMAKPLSEEQMIEVARQFASYARRTRKSPAGAPAAGHIVRLVTRGDPGRDLPACNACHGNYSGGPIGAPVLFGQSEPYLAAQLRAFKSGQRKNDIYARMRNVAAPLTDAEIDGLARFYSAK